MDKPTMIRTINNISLLLGYSEELALADLKWDQVLEEFNSMIEQFNHFVEDGNLNNDFPEDEVTEEFPRQTNSKKESNMNSNNQRSVEVELKEFLKNINFPAGVTHETAAEIGVREYFVLSDRDWETPPSPRPRGSRC